MPLDLDTFTRLRPRLFHLTARSNIVLIRSEQRLLPATDIFRASGESHRNSEHRPKSQIVRVGDKRIHIRDQAPLHAGYMSLSDNWELSDFVRHLNQHVFFWPGSKQGPIIDGCRHFERYQAEDNLVLVLDTKQVLQAKEPGSLRFCSYNSGSPRWNRGFPAPRGPHTFLTADEYSDTPGSVKEVVFRGPVHLSPDIIQVVPPSSLLK